MAKAIETAVNMRTFGSLQHGLEFTEGEKHEKRSCGPPKTNVQRPGRRSTKRRRGYKKIDDVHAAFWLGELLDPNRVTGPADIHHFKELPRCECDSGFRLQACSQSAV
jgi:hypothetical protein